MKPKLCREYGLGVVTLIIAFIKIIVDNRAQVNY